MSVKTMVAFSMLLLLWPLSTMAEGPTDVLNDVQFQINPQVDAEDISFELSLVNNSNKELLFEFYTSQYYEITVTNQKGELYYKFSEGKAFLQAIQELRLKPGESKKWVETLTEREVKEIPGGHYIVDAELKAQTINGIKIDPIKQQVHMVVPPNNPIIKDVSFNQLNHVIHVKGKARPQNGLLYYSVEDGHREWIKETKIKLDSDSPQWKNFSFQLRLPRTNPLFLNIYEKDEKGRILHSYPKVLVR